MVIQAGDSSFDLALHPRLTVIGGLSAAERETLCRELIGALGRSRSGVHLELVDDDGRRLAVFRPHGAPHQVVDVDAAQDLTSEFRSPRGGIDVLGRHGLDTEKATQAMRLTASSMKHGTEGAQLVRLLADVDQATLWAAVERIRQAEEQFNAEASASGASPGDTSIVEEVERRHARVEEAQSRKQRLRRRMLHAGTLAAVAAVPLALMSPVAAIPVLIAVVAAVASSAVANRQATKAAAAEQEALADAGAGTYLGFHLQRVDGLLSTAEARQHFLAAAEAHRAATAFWRSLVGEVTVDWATEHAEEIKATARLRRDIESLGAMSLTAPELDDAATTDLARVLVSRMAAQRRLGTTGESFPLLLDDPFAGIERSIKPSLLELLGQSAGTPQLVLLTEDEDVASWARLEALTGALSILEPTGSPSATPPPAAPAPQPAPAPEPAAAFWRQ